MTVTAVSNKPSGTVIAETPQPGSQLAQGSTVTIRVSRGLVTVPDTVGQSRNDAVAAVRGAGLKPKAFIVPSSQPKGQGRSAEAAGRQARPRRVDRAPERLQRQHRGRAPARRLPPPAPLPRRRASPQR